jgi:SAM-dependent methyltransferase
MADWDDGYVSDVPYVTGYHTESAPVWIDTAATCLGLAAPDITRPFHYADLGCGNGVTALVVAATMPHAEIWAFDFNPAHVGSGRDIARRAGLHNIHFEEASFDDLARCPRDALPTFDYIVAHGVVSWISLENRRRLFNVIGQRLAPGGIAYLSYNVASGWTGMRPVRTLMRLLAEASPERTDLAAAGVFDQLDKMKSAGAAMFQQHPELDARLARFRAADQRYVAHELLNRDWYPVMFPAVASAMAGIKCDYIGSATIHANVAGLTVPAALLDLFGQIRDTPLRETLRDIAGAAGFRRDLYQRGPRRMSPTEHQARLDAVRLARTFRPMEDPFVLQSVLGPLTPDLARYKTLLAVVESGPTTIGQLRAHAELAGWPDQALIEAVTLMAGSGHLAPMLPEPPGEAAKQAAARLNAVHAALFDQGYTRQFLAYPALGAAWPAEALEIVALDELRKAEVAEEQPLSTAVLERVTRGGRELQEGGQTVTDPAAVRDYVTVKVREMLKHRLPAMQRFGLLDAAPEVPA